MRAHEVLELEFGSWIGNPNVVVCSSGTAALHLALECLGLPRGSLVVVPEFTMVSCARAVTLADLTPVFVDCGPDLLIDPQQLFSIQADAVMAVHIYGRRCNMSAIMDWAKQRRRFVIEDLSEAHGIPPHPGTDAACWSFYSNKIIAGQEGGAVAFIDAGRAKLARQLRCVGFTDKHDFNHIPRGHNYRLADALAELILPGLRSVGDNLAQRRRVEQWYESRTPEFWRMPKRDVCWVYDLRIPGMRTPQQDALVNRLNQLGIAARHGFKPMSSQVEYRREGAGRTRAWVLAQEVIYLPVYPDMEEQGVYWVVDQLKAVAKDLGLYYD